MALRKYSFVRLGKKRASNIVMYSGAEGCGDERWVEFGKSELYYTDQD